MGVALIAVRMNDVVIKSDHVTLIILWPSHPRQVYLLIALAYYF